MKKRILSFLLALLMVVSILPTPTYAEDTTDVTVATTEGGQEQTPDYSGDVGKYVKLNLSVNAFTVYGINPTSGYVEEQTFLHEDFLSGTIFQIADWMMKDKILWYQLEVYSGGTTGNYAALFPAEPWFQQTEANELVFLNTCDACGKPDCAVTHVWCETCKQYDCGIDHSTANGVKLEAAVKDVEGNLVTDSEDNPLIVTVSGDAIPKGASLTASEADVSDQLDAFGISAETMVFGLDISLNKDGTVCQPNENVLVKIPVDAEPGTKIGILHTHEGETSFLGFVEVQNDGTVEFETEGFSEFAGWSVVYLQYATFGIAFEGYTTILLSKVLEQVGINGALVSGVTNVESDNNGIRLHPQADGDWLLESTGPFDGDIKLTVTFTNGSIDITAQFKKSYKIMLDCQGQTTMSENFFFIPGVTTYFADQYCTLRLSNNKIVLPTKHTYTLVGFFENTNGQGIKYIEGDGTVLPALGQNLNGSTTLYAHWVPTEYRITYQLNGGTAEKEEDFYTFADSIVLITPSRDGYTFIQWANKSRDDYNAGLNSWKYGGYKNNEPGNNNFGDVTLSAQWSPITYTANFDYNGGNDGEKEKDFTIESTLTLPQLTRAGYTGKWKITSAEGNWQAQTEYAPNSGITNMYGNITFTAQWKPITYTITYDLAGGTVATANKTEYTVETEAFTLNNPSKTGYTFAGWTGTGLDGATKDVTVAKGTTGNREYKATYTANTYTVSFDANGGTVNPASKSVTFDGTYGDLPVPTRTGYSFVGWFTAAENGTQVTAQTAYKTAGNSALYAHWAVNEYTVTWVDGDGKTIKSEQVEYGKVPAYTGADPTKKATAQYTYTFNNTWSPAISAVTGPATYTAQFDSTVNKYQVTWMNKNGDTLKTEMVEYGKVPVYGLADPTMPDSADKTYEFSGWDKQVTAVTGDVTYTAVYEENTREFTITWVDGDGNTLLTQALAYGAMPQYTGATPTKTATAQYTYTFNNTWSPAVSTVTGPATYTAQFDSAVNKYTVTWKDGNGNTLKTEQMPYGDTPVYTGATPTKAGDAQYTHTFNGKWLDADSNELTAATTVTGNVTYTAQFDSAVNKYTVIWVDGDGNTLKTEELEYGDTPAYSGETPTKEPDNRYSYTFNNTWSPAIVSVAGDAVYTAQFDREQRAFTVKWWFDANENGQEDAGEILETDENVAYGAKPSYDGAEPQKASTAEWNYLFAGWYDNVTDYRVTEDVTFKALFNPVKQEYPIHWTNYGGSLLRTDTVRYGDTPNYGTPNPTYAPAVDDGYTYTFTGWTPSVSPVVGEHTYQAVYDKIPKEYSIQYELKQGTEVNGVIQGENQNPEIYTVVDSITLINPTPDKPYYKFTGWSGTGLTGNANMSVTIPAGSTGNRSYTAHYERIGYTISFDTNGAKEQTVADISYQHGDSVTVPVVTRDGYTYVWKVDSASGSWTVGTEVVSGVMNQYGDVTLKAEWAPISYSIAFHKNADSAEGEMQVLAMEYDIAKKLAPCGFTRTGYSFKGWANTANGPVVYANLEEVKNLTAENGKTIDLYAVWEINLFNLTIKTNNTVDTNQSYIFTVTGTAVDGTEINLQVVMGANDEQKIVGMPAGTYTVADQQGWSWRYDHQSQERTVYTDVVADFSYTYNKMTDTKIYWLNGYGNDQIVTKKEND